MWRHVTATCLGLLLVAMLHGLWQWQTHQAMQAALAPLEARGVPTTVKAMNEQWLANDLADADNRAIPLLNAAAMAAGATESWRNSPDEMPDGASDHTPFWPAYEKLQRDAFADPANQRAIAEALKSLDREGADWGNRYDETNPIATGLPQLNGQRQLANLLSDAAAFNHHEGRHDEVVPLLRTLLHQAEGNWRNPLVVSWLVGIGIEALQHHALMQTIPTLRIDNGEQSATREQVESLLADLVDETNARKYAERAFLSEVAVMPDAIDSEFPRTRPTSRAVVRAFAAPDMTRYRQAAERIANQIAPPPPVAETKPDDDRSYAASIVESTNWWSGMTERFETSYRRIQFGRRAAAVAVAARLYRLDHNNAWPQSLNELVPAYLPVVPVDPYASDAAAVGYLVLRWPDGSPRPVVFSVGDDGNADVTATWQAGEMPDVWPNGEPR
ncbi:MAG: hypothetical protein AAGK78_10060, partial [Planctomycetota bacterium]